jgi:hypothetical protein
MRRGPVAPGLSALMRLPSLRTTEEFWRAQVERCLHLAMETCDPAVAEALRQLAEEYRARADELRDTNNRKTMSPAWTGAITRDFTVARPAAVERRGKACPSGYRAC